MSDQRITGFDDREKGYERKFQQDQELAFKVRVRRNRHFGLWVAERLGLAGEAAETYAQDLVSMSLAHAGDDGILAMVSRDLAGKGVTLDATVLGTELLRCEAEAKQHLGAAS
jgi:hypothetical protein